MGNLRSYFLLNLLFYTLQLFKLMSHHHLLPTKVKKKRKKKVVPSSSKVSLTIILSTLIKVEKPRTSSRLKYIHKHSPSIRVYNIRINFKHMC